MKNIIALLIFAIVSMSAMSQSFLGHTTKEYKLHETAGDKTPIIKTLPAETPVLIISLDPENKDYFNVIEIATGDEGYISKDAVKVGKQVKGGDKAILKMMGEIVSVNPELDIINSTNKPLKLKIDGQLIEIAPKSHKTTTLTAGTFRYKAFSPGCVPITGKEELKANHEYTWEFDFITPYEKDE